MSIQHKSFDLDLKDDGGDGFMAYFAAFGNVDRVGEIIEPGAFKNLGAFSADGWVGTNHDMEMFAGAGYPTEVGQDARGLWVRGKWHSTPDAQVVRTKVKERLDAGKSVKCSIGYKVLDSFKDVAGGRSVTRLTALDLFEVSFVNIPANPAASVLAAKSHDPSVLTLDSLKALIETETKAGRVLSRANCDRLKGWHGTLSKMCGDLKDMIDAHDPDGDPGSEPDGDPDDMAAMKSLEKLRAASLRARLTLLQPSA